MGIYEPLKVNQPVEIELPKSKDCYRSRVEGILSNKITLAAPLKQGQIVSLSPGTIVRVMFSDQMASYSFKSKLISQNRQNPPTVTLGEPYDLKRTQRRNFVRLETKLSIVFAEVNEDYETVGDTFSGTTIDLSGGGVMFACNTLLKYGDILDLTVVLTESDSAKALGKVVRFSENPPNSKQKYSVGLEFTAIEESERDKIIKFIFNKQRELRRKGLL
ncbi:MAG: PilZ domain-containing protein [Thermincola sp.]|jgi:c-di-GMP-binding flagellar brake protein YcgR|nr:PilZ domain-containing protein [Thermincola sp.]MDT3701773.1 PilZ domain-containing protein [Thermincola sp.]